VKTPTFFPLTVSSSTEDPAYSTLFPRSYPESFSSTGAARDLPVRAAIVAETIQANLMPGRSIARRFRELPCQGVIDRQIKIGYSPTTLADEVMVRQGGSLVPVKLASKVESAHQPLFHKNPRVPIDGAQTGVRELLSHPVERPLRRRVTPGLSKDFEYAITLPALASVSCHSLRSPPANRNCY